MYRKTVVILLLGTMFLSGCTYFRKPLLVCQDISWKDRKLAQSRITDWQMSGVFSITYGNKRDIANFNWQQKLDNYTINISGPMDIGNARVAGDIGRVRFWRASGEVFEADTPEQLMESQLGWRLPISDIRYWILGIPAPTKVDYKYFDRYGHMNFFKQKGWQVKYSGFWCGVKKGVDLPQTIELTNKGVVIKIKIKKQRLN